MIYLQHAFLLKQ